MDIHQLVERCQKGETDLFAEIYESFVDKIYKFVYYKVLDTTAAENITSDTFIKAIENICKFDASYSQFSTWLFSIARNTTVDYFRKKKYILPLNDIWDIPSDENITEDLENKLLFSKLHDVLSKIKPEQREIITLRFWGNLSHREIAEITCKSEGSVKMIMSRLLIKLKDELSILFLSVYYINQYRNIPIEKILDR